jgi:adenylate kinase
VATFIVMLGPPGVGKGTQAKILAEKTGLAHVSSGDLFRDNIKSQTELGQLAQSYMNKGELVPDDVTIAMVRERISRPDCQAGAILDGFPRTPAQANALKQMLAEFNEDVDHVPFVNADEEVLVARLSGRWTCRANGHVFHATFNPPKNDGICDLDGSELYQRDDDKVETVKRRIQVYMKQTAPLIEYYREAGKLIEVDGAQPIDDVTASLVKALEK